MTTTQVTGRLECCRPWSDIVVEGELGGLLVHWVRDPVDDGDPASAPIYVHLQQKGFSALHLMLGPFSQEALAMLATEAIMSKLMVVAPASTIPTSSLI